MQVRAPGENDSEPILILQNRGEMVRTVDIAQGMKASTASVSVAMKSLQKGGYIHLGDALIYLAACLLPAPYAVGAAMVGAGLADLLTAPLWVVPTLLIKALVALLFTSRGPRLLCPRNGAALLLACLLSPAAYGLAACLLQGGVNAFWPQFLGTLVQAVGSGAVFTVLALALDRAGGKARLAPHSQG